MCFFNKKLILLPLLKELAATQFWNKYANDMMQC